MAWPSLSFEAVWYFANINCLTILLVEQHEKKRYVKPDMFYMRKRKTLSSGSTAYKHQRDELAHLSKLNPLLSPRKKRDKKGKEKIDPFASGEKRRSWFLQKIWAPSST